MTTQHLSLISASVLSGLLLLSSCVDSSSVSGTNDNAFASVIGPDAPVAAPSNVNTSVVSSSSVNISWTDNSHNETGFAIERRLGSGSFNALATTAANVTAYNDSTVAGTQNYSYRVRAFSDSQISEYSTISSINTPNAIPIANAGPDQQVDDDDDSGSEVIALDGSASSDNDGGISSHLWSWDSEVVINQDSILTYTDQDYGTGTSIESGNGIELAGNAWKCILYPFTITANTTLSFEARISTAGEIQGIGFDSDTNISESRTFQLAGSQTYGTTTYKTLPADDQWYTISIPIGSHYTGNFQYLYFVGDDDSASNQECAFRNVRLYDQAGGGYSDGSQIDFTTYDPVPYTSQDKGAFNILNGGSEIELTANSWKSIALPISIQATSILKFETRVNVLGEIHGIGFDDNPDNYNADRIFALAGTQNFGNTTYKTVSTDGSWNVFEIPIGTHYTGNFSHLFFIGDDDANENQVSAFRNISVENIGAGMGSAQKATGVNPNITFPRGTHNVTLTVTDTVSATDTDTVEIVVSEVIAGGS